jgi:hypothetical protein
LSFYYCFLCLNFSSVFFNIFEKSLLRNVDASGPYNTLGAFPYGSLSAAYKPKLDNLLEFAVYCNTELNFELGNGVLS